MKCMNLKLNLENLDDKCKNANATNSISREASILKDNIELKAQLELLTSNYRKLAGWPAHLRGYLVYGSLIIYRLYSLLPHLKV
jgi:hypothetical protein